MTDKVGGTFHPIRKWDTAHEGRRDNCRKHIARTGTITPDLHMIIAAALSILIEVRAHAVARVKAGNDNSTRPHRCELVCHVGQLCIGYHAVRRIRQIEELTRLCEVWRHDVCMRHKLTHLRTERGRI